MSAHDDDQKKKRTTAMILLQFPQTASHALVKGIIEQFKKSQRLPPLSRLMEARKQASKTPGDLEFGNFYHI